MIVSLLVFLVNYFNLIVVLISFFLMNISFECLF